MPRFPVSRLAVALAPIVLAGSLVAARAEAPSFDCARSTGPVEKAICRSPRLARLDLRIDAAYRRAMRAWRDDPLTREALRSAQRDLLDRRDAALAEPDDGLARLLEEQATFLEAIDAAPRHGFAGEWGNLTAGIRIEPTAAGIAVWGNRVEPVRFRWVCDIDDLGVVVDAALVSPPAAATGARADWSIRLERHGAAVRVREVGPAGTETLPDGTAVEQSPRCGRGGRFDGIYFPTRATMRTR